MNLIFLGPPGVGKGTQAKYICEKYNILHLSTGDILRFEIDEETETGTIAKKYIDNGELVPDKILLTMMNSRLKKEDSKNGYLLDGFPRTIPQADGLDKIMKNINHKLDIVISLTAKEDELINRLINRGLDLGRSDDSPEIIRNRQKIYWKQTSPLLLYYKNNNFLKSVNGIGTISDITQKIINILDQYA